MVSSAARKPRKQVTEKRNRQYARKCKLCKRAQKLGYSPSRAVISGHAVWMHDSVLSCKAWELREKHWLEDHPEDKKK